MRAFFDVEYDRNVYDDELRVEFERLRKMDPETYDYSYERYVENCTCKNGALEKIDVEWFEFETLWLAKEIAQYLKNHGIRFELKTVNNMFRQFRVLASVKQIKELKSYIAIQ